MPGFNKGWGGKWNRWYKNVKTVRKRVTLENGFDFGFQNVIIEYLRFPCFVKNVKNKIK